MRRSTELSLPLQLVFPALSVGCLFNGTLKCGLLAINSLHPSLTFEDKKELHKCGI
jgi:hypothetical protein